MVANTSAWARWPRRGTPPAPPGVTLPPPAVRLAAVFLEAPRLAVVLALLLVALQPAGLWALSEQELEERVQRISEQLRCPTCQAVSVRDSEAAFSRQIREKVRRMVQEGQSDEDIKAFFVSRYGEWILRAPRKEGLGLVLWIAPGAALLLAGGLIGLRLYRGSRRTAAANAGETASLTPAQRGRVARDLQRFEDEG